MTKYVIVLYQDRAEAKDKVGARNLSQVTRMEVPREELHNAVLHYKGKRALGLVLKAEEKFPVIEVVLKGVTLSSYCETMFKGGRWKDKGKDNRHVFGEGL